MYLQIIAEKLGKCSFCIGKNTHKMTLIMITADSNYILAMMAHITVKNTLKKIKKIIVKYIFYGLFIYFLIIFYYKRQP